MPDVVYNTNVTSDLSVEMKTFYKGTLLDNSVPKLVHRQFADKYPIPKGNGKQIEFRRFTKLPKALTPLVEGVTPAGRKTNVTSDTKAVQQFGDFVATSDMLEMTAVDNVIVQNTKLLGSQSGRTLDSLCRDELAGGTNVIYAPKISAGSETPVLTRSGLDKTAKLTPDLVFKAAAQLQAMDADDIDGSYVAIIHPYASYDLMRNEEWLDVHKYALPEQIASGEIGRIGKVRFVETSEAKIWKAKDLTAGARSLKVKTAIAAATKTVTVEEAITADDATALVGRNVLIGGTKYTIETATAGAAGSASIALTENISTAGAKDAIYPGEAGGNGTAVFATIVFGAHAFACIDIESGGLEHIVKPRGAGEDPLNQRSTIGWKATDATKRLSEEYLVRIESCSSYSDTASAN